MSLKQKGVAGIFWTFLQQFSSQIINFGVSLVLARLLMPKDFGTIALFNILIGVSTVIINSGMTISLVRSKEIDEEDLSTVFIFNMGVSIIMFFLTYCIAPFFAEFYKIEILTSIIRVYAVVLIINALFSVQSTILTKNLKFKTQFKMQIPSLIVSGALGLILAIKGYGVWSLVYMAICQSSMQALQHWIYSEWKPSFKFNRVKFKTHFGFGVNLMLSSVLDILFQNIYTIVIGKFYNSTQLGYYDRANNLKQLPVSNLASALNKVTYPLFAEIQNDNERLRNVYKKIMQIVIFVTSPIMVVMLIQAELLVKLLLTDKWLPIVPYLQILILAGILQPIHSYNINILQIRGKSKQILYIEIIKKILIVIMVVATFRFGIVGLLWGQVAISIISFVINSKYSGKLINYDSFEQIKDLVPTILLAFLIGGVIFIFDFYINSHLFDWIRLLIDTLSYFIIYLLTAYLLKMSSLLELKTILRLNK